MSSPTPELPVSAAAAAPGYVVQKRPPTVSAEIQSAKTAETAETAKAETAKAETAKAEDAENAKPLTFKEESSSDSEVGSCTNCHYNSQGQHCSFQPKSKFCERSISVASSSAGSAKLANRRKRVTKRKCSSMKKKFGKLLEALENMADAIQDIMEDMED